MSDMNSEQTPLMMHNESSSRRRETTVEGQTSSRHRDRTFRPWRRPSSSRGHNKCGMPSSSLTLGTVIVLLVCGGLLLATQMVPTRDEAATLRFHGYSVTRLAAMRTAQAIADDSQGWLNHELKHALFKLRKHADDDDLLWLDRSNDKMDINSLNNNDDVDHHHRHDNHDAADCEATVLIVRHCEKGNVREHCNYVGFERSVFLSTQFGTRWPVPACLYALHPGGRHNRHKYNFREVETLGATAARFDLRVHDDYTTHHVRDLAHVVLDDIHHGTVCGKVIVIAWKHSDIGRLAHHLGCGPNEGCPLDYSGRTFDATWQIKFVYDRSWHSTRHSLKLPNHASWHVYGAVVAQNFDPLAFSYAVGDYYHDGGGTNKDDHHHDARSGLHHPHWRSSALEVPERQSARNETTWRDLV